MRPAALISATRSERNRSSSTSSATLPALAPYRRMRASASSRTRRLEPHSAQSMLSRSTNDTGQARRSSLRQDPCVAHEPRLGTADGAAVPARRRAGHRAGAGGAAATDPGLGEAAPSSGRHLACGPSLPARASRHPSRTARSPSLRRLREQRLRDVRGEHHEAAAPRPECPEWCMALADDERVPQPVVERRRGALSAGRGGHAVHDAGLRHDEEPVPRLVRAQRPVRVLAVEEELARRTSPTRSSTARGTSIAAPQMRSVSVTEANSGPSGRPYPRWRPLYPRRGSKRAPANQMCPGGSAKRIFGFTAPTDGSRSDRVDEGGHRLGLDLDVVVEHERVSRAERRARARARGCCPRRSRGSSRCGRARPPDARPRPRPRCRRSSRCRRPRLAAARRSTA